MTEWSPELWKKKPALQQPVYEDQADLDRVVRQISQLPPLVTSWEVDKLKAQLAEAAQGKRFLLQGGDCAETFADCNSATIVNKLKILLQMSLILIHATQKKVIRVGRLAGQYAKPRSSDMESRSGHVYPSYRGDMVNAIGFSQGERRPQADLLLRAYERAALTLNFIRSLIDGGFADLHHPEYWNLDFIPLSSDSAAYEKIVTSIAESLRFMETVTETPISNLERVDFFTSHEGLHLSYEEAQTRQVPHKTGWYNLSAHFLWIGNRTRVLDGAHVEYFRGIVNPIGVKVGPDIRQEELLALTDILNPKNEPGRLTVIHRFGLHKVEECLPPLIDAMQKNNKIVTWCCDPMHGNNEVTEDGTKTRNFDKILQELKHAFRIYREMNAYLGGVHFELTGDNVTECLGGARGLSSRDLKRAYKSNVDPRLNYEQSLEMALLIAREMAQK